MVVCSACTGGDEEIPVEPVVVGKVRRVPLEETLELWMGRHEDSLKKIVDRLEGALASQLVPGRNSVASSTFGAIRMTHFDDEDVEDAVGEESRADFEAGRVTMMTNASSRFTVKKTLRSMSDLFTTEEDEKRRKHEQILAQDAGQGARVTLGRKVVSATLVGAVFEFIDPRRGNLRDKLRMLVTSVAFQLFAAAMILFSVSSLGVDVEYQARHGESMTELVYAMVIVNFWYILEVLLRMAAFGMDFFMSEEDRLWNCFDLFLACISIFELFMPDSSGSRGSSLLRVIRVVRLFRCLRLVRWLRHMREFRKMIFSMLVSVQTLIWAVVLLLFMLYCFGVWFTTAATQHLQEFPEQRGGDLEGYFGSLALSMYSLWLAISGGLNWYYIVLPLFKLDRWLVGLFVGFIATMLLGVMNIVTSVFVESAMRSTQHYRDLMLQEKARTKETLVKHLRQIFYQMDQDSSGMISLQEMRAFLEDETLELRRYFEALEVNAEDAKALFKLLDRDDSGEIDIEEFCDGCMRLKGEARSFDINCLLYNTQRVENRLVDIGDGLDAVIGLCGDILLSVGFASPPRYTSLSSHQVPESPLGSTGAAVARGNDGPVQHMPSGEVVGDGVVFSPMRQNRRNSLRTAFEEAGSSVCSMGSVASTRSVRRSISNRGFSFKERAAAVRRISSDGGDIATAVV